MKVSLRTWMAAVFVILIVAFTSAILLTHGLTSRIANVSIKPRLLGKWSFPDRFGRTTFWEFGDSGLLKRHASDAPADIDQYQWWVKDSVLTVRQPMKLYDRIHHSFALALHGRKLNDARQEFQLSEISEGSWQMTWTDPDGERNSVVMRREDDEQSVMNP